MNILLGTARCFCSEVADTVGQIISVRSSSARVVFFFYKRLRNINTDNNPTASGRVKERAIQNDLSIRSKNATFGGRALLPAWTVAT